ncbi:hypothetical protein CLV51_1021214 [Chitinophaga niastensis]|uniref:Uncharacterized protein n=1 Tax=Chitinophaga niastensis TaxID=536980 RepID=A0A2P8HQ63_CHINA|nr:alpha/beta hydrolase-fold protein [Chitinophaga niastensis]PSL48347.1 hypothetical protein CLV51_1021214 [Chitinophaga niastensis]
MKLLLPLLLSFSLLSVQAQQADNKIVIGTIDHVYSTVLKENRTIWVHVPDNADKLQRYPVLYLLDGEDHFHATVGMVKQMSGVWPDMIVVGIINTSRNRDLTPTHATADNMIDNTFASMSGGGENFIRFIEKELIPYIDSLYPTAPYRLFSGHSLGGLTVVNALIHHTKLFNAYIAIDPSLWWDHQQLLKEAEKALATRKFDHTSLFVAMANNMPPGMDTISVLKDASQNTAVTRSVIPFIKALRANSNNCLRWDAKFYPGERHGTVELNGEYDALRFLFNYYQFKTSMFSYDPALDVDSVLTAHFRIISENLGYTVLPAESQVNNLAYMCMGNKKMDKAYLLFRRNIDNYPQSANAYDSMGDYYAAAGNTAKAIEAYSQSLRLQETTDTRKKLEALSTGQ